MKEKTIIKKTVSASPFKNLAGLEYFDFEEDFVETGMRCIPMIVRFKMDIAGIKLSLAAWNTFTQQEKISLALMPCNIDKEIIAYHDFLATLIRKYTGTEPDMLSINKQPLWNTPDVIPQELKDKAATFRWTISQEQWKGLTLLQRFALLKLCRPGHENKNFPKAMKEFGLI